MIPKQNPAIDPLTPVAPSLTEPMPTPAGAGAPALRCIQRPTGEWFTLAAGNAAGKDTPDATELLTESEARQRLDAAGLAPAEIDARLAQARANPEITGDELPLPDPVVGASTASGEPQTRLSRNGPIPPSDGRMSS